MSSITINIEGPLTARWSINGSGSYESGNTISLSPGTYTISFSDEPNYGVTPEDLVLVLDTEPITELVYYFAWATQVIGFEDIDNWITPDSFEVTMTGCVPLEFTKDYKHSFDITIVGPESARYSINGSGSYSSGEHVELVYADTYTISFLDISGLVKPEDIILDNPTGALTTTVIYKQSILINIYPNTATYSINGSGTYNSGETYLIDYAAPYTFVFSDIAGLTKPDDIVVSPTENYESIVYYKKQIQINLYPNTATYSINATNTYVSGEVYLIDCADQYIISFSDISGLIKPENITLTTEETAPAHVYYQQSFKININPDYAVYSINGDGAYVNNTVVLVNYATSYTLSFVDITGLIKPSDIVLTDIYEPYETTVHYKRSIRIYITPDHATYTVNGTGPYNNGDLVEVNFAPTHTIVFESIVGLGRPDDIVLDSVGHYETTVEYSIIRRFLVRSNSKYYSFDINTTTWTDITDNLSVGEPLPEEYDLYGMSRFEDFATHMSELPDATNTQVFYYIGRQPETTPKLNLNNVTQRPNIITSNNLLLTDIVSINSITLTALNENDSKLYIIVTPNDGQEYYTYKNNAWVGIARTTSDIINEGMTIEEFNNVNEKFNDILNKRSKKLKFLFVMVHNDPTDILEVDKLVYNVNLNGRYQYMNRPTTYTMEFVSNEMVQIKLFEEGTFKINY